MTTAVVVSWDVMTYRGGMHHLHSRRSAAYRLGYALGSTITRLIVWPVVTVLHAGDSE
jgi:hypothetical protein